MSQRILIAVAWPYANGSIHIGQVAGVYLPADIFARYHRMKGNSVLMVSGSDAHGTPVTLTAERLGTSPEQVSGKYQTEFLDNWNKFGITFDLFTTTHTANHFEVVQDIFMNLYEKDYIYKDTMLQPYCKVDNRFLADRYVGGICPNCNFDGARGDQCDNCSKTLDPKDLINMTCLLCNNSPVIKETEHFFLRLSAFEKQLSEWVESRKDWKSNVRNFTLGYLKSGLHDRAITRDITWGIPLPIEGYETKRIYVWFEAVIGYLSASKEWAHNSGNTNVWEKFWKTNSQSFYFMGKDNIPFHTIIWPAILMGYGELNLPYDVPANEYMNLEGAKLSTSRNWAIWLPDYLEKYEPDPLRYVIAANMPESSDSDFSWREYVRCNNDELVATYGNLVQRVLTMISRNFDNRVPSPNKLTSLDNQLIKLAQDHISSTGTHLEKCRFRQALQSAMNLAQLTNQYLEQKEPWRSVKTNPEEAASTLWVSISVINCLKTQFYPCLPFSSEKLHKMLGFKGSVRDTNWTWDPYEIERNQVLGKIEPLFTKLDKKIIESEMQNLVN